MNLLTKKYSFLLLILKMLDTTSVHADMNSLAKEMIQESLQVKEAKNTFQLRNLEVNDVTLELVPTFNLQSSYRKTALEGFPFNNPNGILSPTFETDTISANFSKPFSWGGRVFLDNSIQKFKPQGVSSFFGMDQTLGYEQDLWRNFFGRQFKLRKNTALERAEASKFELTVQQNATLFDFSRSYLSASLAKELVSYQKRAIKRIKKRIRITKRRVRDGVSEKVELFEARTFLERQKELLQDQEVRIESELIRLSQLIGRDVSVSEIDTNALRNLRYTKILKEDVENASIKQLRATLKSIEGQFNNAKNSLFPELVFRATLRSNNYDGKVGTAFSDGLVGNERKEVTVGIDLQWDIGSHIGKNERAKSRLQKSLAKERLSREEYNQKSLASNLWSRIKNVEKTIKFAQKRLRNNNTILKEYEKLYKKGRADFDQVIRAEESVINNESDLARFYVSREKLVFEHAHNMSLMKKILKI